MRGRGAGGVRMRLFECWSGGDFTFLEQKKIEWFMETM